MVLDDVAISFTSFVGAAGLPADVGHRHLGWYVVSVGLQSLLKALLRLLERAAKQLDLAKTGEGFAVLWRTNEHLAIRAFGLVQAIGTLVKACPLE